VRVCVCVCAAAAAATPNVDKGAVAVTLAKHLTAFGAAKRR
jgi:hypothetical protein